MLVRRLCLASTLLLLLAGHAVAEARRTDVLVYGSTPGGVCAAIAAAREGAAVILLEPTAHVGGMSTGGLSHCDSNQMVRSTMLGLFDEWHHRIVADYTSRGLPAPYNPSIKDQSTWTFEPHVAMRVTKQMLSEAGVTVLTDQPLETVEKKGPRITSITTTQEVLAARVYVDATYEGDLMAAAGVDWTIGREGRADYDESLAGKQFSKQRMKINGLNAAGEPLPLVTAVDAGEEEAGDDHIMTYSFRLCLTDKPDNHVPIPAPAHYDPARFEVVRRALEAGERRVGFDLYPLPGTKLDGNNSIGGQFSIGLVGGNAGWHAANPDERQQIWESHKQYTLEFIHFLTTDPAVPRETRARFASLGFCRDEFAATDHFPPALYVRESRRMQGLYVISQKDILESPEKPDAIAISSFPIDSHDCQRIALPDGGVVNEGTIFPVRKTNPKQGYAYHVPLRSLLPKEEQCDNLLVPVALSCTHVGMSSLRIEGAWMTIGQSAGIAAALTADADVPAQRLDYQQLRERLLAAKQVLDLPPDVRRTVERSLPYIQERGTWWIEQKDCVSCHRVDMMAWSLTAAERHGFAVGDALASCRAWAVDSTLKTDEEGVVAGLSNKEGVAHLLLGCDEAALPAEVRKQLTSLLLADRQPSGCWKAGGQLPMQKRPAEETDAVSSMWLALALSRYATDETTALPAEILTATENAAAVTSTEWHAVRVLLALACHDADTTAQSISALQFAQNADGGWGWLLDEESDALGTGLALYALRAGGVGSDEPSLTNAVRFLTDSQQADGSWAVRGTKEKKRNKVEETATYWGSTWAVLGLLATLPDPAITTPPGRNSPRKAAADRVPNR
ncbi:MAG: FAD-dependent oxidoreductase [Pirellulales bacterium]